MHLHPWVEAGGAQPVSGILLSLQEAGMGRGGHLWAEPRVVTQTWLFWGPSWKQCDGQGWSQGGGEWAGKAGIGPWHLSPYATSQPPQGTKAAGDTVGLG